VFGKLFIYLDVAEFRKSASGL